LTAVSPRMVMLGCWRTAFIRLTSCRSGCQKKTHFADGSYDLQYLVMLLWKLPCSVLKQLPHGPEASPCVLCLSRCTYIAREPLRCLLGIDTPKKELTNRVCSGIDISALLTNTMRTLLTRFEKPVSISQFLVEKCTNLRCHVEMMLSDEFAVIARHNSTQGLRHQTRFSGSLKCFNALREAVSGYCDSCWRLVVLGIEMYSRRCTPTSLVWSALVCASTGATHLLFLGVACTQLLIPCIVHRSLTSDYLCSKTDLDII
jgi:hypothetical protein